MAAINKNHKSSYKDFQQKMNTAIFNLNMISAITRNNKNGYHGSNVQDRDLQQKPNTTKCGLTFNLSIISAILDGSHY